MNPVAARASKRLLELSSIVKDYHGLRPLRIERFALHAGELVAITGLDAPAAETFVNVVTGAALPDSGRIMLFGRDSASISDSTDWLSIVDRFGIVSARAVLLEQLSVAQNLAMPFSLDIDPLGDALRARAVASGREAGVSDSDFDRRVADVDAPTRLRIRVARALALDPDVVLLEHPSAELPRDESPRSAAEIREILTRRAVAGLALTADLQFAHAFASKIQTLNVASGRLSDGPSRWLRRLVQSGFWNGT
jgi:ABC-type lipoprotein export system ATPase subunit